MCGLFLSRSSRLTFCPEYRTSPAAHLPSCSVDVVDPSPALKQLMHEADHLSLFSAEATDECSYNRTSPVCLHGVHRDIFTFYHCVGGMTPIFVWM